MLYQALSNKLKQKQFSKEEFFKAGSDGDFKGLKSQLNLLGANIDVTYGSKRTLLMYAVAWGDVKLVQFLLEAGANFHISQPYETSALHIAANSGNAEIAQLLINAGADVNVGNSEKMTPLHYAATSLFVNKEIIQTLLNAGANINALNKYNMSALFFAAKQGNFDAISLLLERKAIPDKHYLNIVENTNTDSINPEMSVNQNYEVFSAEKFIEAAKKSYIVEIRCQLALPHANIQSVDVNCFSALHWAVANEDTRMIEVLLQKGSDINATDFNGSTPLITAMYSGNIFMVQLLLESGADVNARNNFECTALHIAAEKHNTQVIGILLKNGADCTLADKNGKTPSQLAPQNSNAQKILVNQEEEHKKLIENVKWAP